MLRRVRWAFLVGGIALLALSLSASPSGAAGEQVVVLQVQGTINPVVGGYVGRGIREAEDREAAAVVIQLDTPGGLDSAMRDAIQHIVNSNVPVVVYVSPPGARAASAGLFITISAHVAAMAPNTAIGAAHPVAGGGDVMDETMEAKVVNDAVAYIRSLAQSNNRNADWAERAVRESVSVPETEAVELKVVDLVARDLESLLSEIDGRDVNLLLGEATLRTKDAEIIYVDMTAIEHFLFTISDPNIAYILLSLAMTGIFLELSNPGAILPGIVGGIALLLAFFSLGMLPVNYVGLLLMVLAFVFFVAELFVTSHGLLAAGGVASFTVGSLILMSSSEPYFSIDHRLIAVIVISVSAFFIFIVGSVVRGQRRRATTGREGLIGKVGVARSPLNPRGFVFVDGERWTAEADSPVEEGEEIIVVEASGFRLKVTKNREE